MNTLDWMVMIFVSIITGLILIGSIVLLFYALFYRDNIVEKIFAGTMLLFVAGMSYLFLREKL